MSSPQPPSTTESIVDDIPKCPCCNNPWAAATSEIFAKLCADCDTSNNKTEKAVTTSSLKQFLDETISPTNNFYHYANGSWIQENPIPAGYPSWNTFLQLHTLSQERLKDLLVADTTTRIINTAQTNDGNSNEIKVKTFYNAAMDEDKIESLGIEPLQNLLELCDNTANAAKDERYEDLASCLGHLLAKYGVSAFFSIGASPDNKQSDMSICQIAQGGLCLPDRDYYFDEDKEDKRIAYKTHIANMLSLLQNNNNNNNSGDIYNNDTFIQIANDIFDLETKLAKGHMTKTQNRDPESTYNKMSIHELSSSSTYSDPKFSFPNFFHAATNKTIDELGHVNIRNIEAIQIATTLITSIDHNVLKNYLRWRSIRSCAQYLTKAFVNEDFNFNEKILAGTNEIKPRWKRAMAFTENALGEALGQMYCAKYFDESCKQKALFIVESVRQALEDRLKEVDWIKSDSTRQEALKKMSRFNVKIGYPDKWIDYSTLDIQSDDSFMTMIFKSRIFDHEREVNEMNAPTDRHKWFMTPQTVNAYYHPNLNEIVFPAAILQAPFFDPTADDAVNFGSMGAVVGKFLKVAVEVKT